MTGDSDPGTDADAAGQDGLDEIHVVTVFLRNEGAILLLRRSDAVGSYSGHWGAVAGHAECEARPRGASRIRERGVSDAERLASEGDPDAAAYEEIREETGLDPDADTALVRRGDPFAVVDDDLGKRWVVHPSLFDSATRSVDPNEETDQFEWVAPTAILRRKTVPDLWRSYDRVRPTIETVAADADHGSAWLSLRALEVLRDEAALAAERADHVDSWSQLTTLARDLLDARPSMAVVANRVNRAMDAAAEAATPAALEAAAFEGTELSKAADADAAAFAADRVPDRIATLSRSGTVATAVERADPEAVLVAESRPGREGVGTAERLAERTDATVTLTTDAALADRLAATDVGAVVVGADTVLPDGRVLNKVGTRAAAAVAAAEGIDCYVVAASDKIAAAEAHVDGADPAEADGVDREERDPVELYDGDASVAVANPTFDVTPPDLIDAVVTERGALDPVGTREVAEEHRALAAWDE
ncbi:NUDIX domain-containing protein [Halosimplex litoreum]|uniref:NUDIX domain-containing protein n=1 Tax=Halosimplex litoreum TaxID=1198301 RepID=A0A7T3KTT2_9EURY|nr:NUDIX domain-containing protein [Halosimplex litoreum]QPV61329.1 NUDIX domain-containing protein [Halosimplex litoreum]